MISPLPPELVTHIFEYNPQHRELLQPVLHELVANVLIKQMPPPPAHPLIRPWDPALMEFFAFPLAVLQHFFELIGITLFAIA